MSYVVAFNRNRDFYQVPIALYRAGLLEQLVTDFYRPDWLKGIPWYRHRMSPELPSRLVTNSGMNVLRQLIEPRLGIQPFETFSELDAILSNKALRLAVASNSNLFLYSNYAYEAFTSTLASKKVKGLFMFHPHTALIQQTLSADFEKFPDCKWSYENEEDTSSSGRLDKLDTEWSLADFIVCASTFTRRSLEYAGCPAEKIVVLPYGATVEATQVAKPNGKVEFLFVGQGVQRKGLHHLLLAWKKAGLSDARLSVVAGKIDPGILRLASSDVNILGRQNDEKLRELYSQSHVFVMPSLIEGFGLVFLEALSFGCFCIGTTNTGLVDIDPGSECSKAIEPGDLQSLTNYLQEAYVKIRSGEHQASTSIKVANRQNWRAFQDGIAAIAQSWNK